MNGVAPEPSSVPGRALVTGASGFIGSALARRLADDGCEVHLLIRETTQRPLPRGLDEHSNVATYVVPASTETLVALVADIAPDACFHVASLFLAQHDHAQVTQLVDSNVRFPAQLAEACVQLEAVRFVNVGTSWQHYESGDAYRPVNLYAATKQAFRDVLDYYVDATPLRAVTLELFDTYGPGDERGKLLAALAARAEPGAEPLRMSPGEQDIDLLHVDDVVDALLHAWRLLDAGDLTGHRSFGLTSGERRSLRELVDLMAEVLGRRPAVEFGALPYRDREVLRAWEPGAEAALPGWAPRRPLSEGLASVFRGDHTSPPHEGAAS